MKVLFSSFLGLQFRGFYLFNFYILLVNELAIPVNTPKQIFLGRDFLFVLEIFFSLLLHLHFLVEVIREM